MPNEVPAAWDAVLTAALAILLGERPIDDPAASYGVYFASAGKELFFPNTWMTPATLVDPTPRELPVKVYELSPLAWRFDLSRSLIQFDADVLDGTNWWTADGVLGPTPFSAEFAADVRAASMVGAREALVRGADLGPLLARHGVDLADQRCDKLGLDLNVLFRVATDGTLVDAMRAATFTMGGPEYLVPAHGAAHFDKAEAKWEEALAAVPHPGLRDHLRRLCIDNDDNDSVGGLCCEDLWWPYATEYLADIGCELVTSWIYTEWPDATAVVRLPDALAPDRVTVRRRSGKVKMDG